MMSQMEMREEKLYSTCKAAKLLGISFITIKRWIYAGRIKAIRTPTKRYLIPESEIRRLLGQQAPKNRAVIYARVSSADQRDLIRPGEKYVIGGCDPRMQKKMFSQAFKEAGGNFEEQAVALDLRNLSTEEAMERVRKAVEGLSGR